jgi:multisubunit Na+/H+ antiporter MnhC subunit
MRFLIAMLVAFATWTTSAFATAHGAPATDITPLGMLVYEVQHFAMHFGLTWEAMTTYVANPEAGVFLMSMATDPMCTKLSPLTGMLFASPTVAVLTVLTSIMIGFIFMMWVLWMLAQILGQFKNLKHQRLAHV